LASHCVFIQDNDYPVIKWYNPAMEEELSPTTNNENTPPQRPSVLPWIGLVLLAFALGLGTGYFVWVRPLQARVTDAEARLAAAQADQTAQAEQAIPEEVQRYDVPEDDDPVFGDANAAITIIEFSDYECPFCRRWHQEVWPQIQAQYGDQVRLVYRDFPLYSIHPNAEPAAVAANCAGDQGRYWEFSDMLFNGSEVLSSDLYTSYAEKLNLDLNKFSTCVADAANKQEIEADFNYASELGVRSTPTFFINGLAVVGAQPFDVFQQIIDLELSGKIPK